MMICSLCFVYFRQHCDTASSGINDNICFRLFRCASVYYAVMFSLFFAQGVLDGFCMM